MAARNAPNLRGSLQTFSVGFLWDGADARPEEVVHVALICRHGRLEVHVDAPFHGDLAPAGPVGPTDRLWEHEVVELFIVGLAPAGEPTPYLEIELSPHGHYLVLELCGVRQVVRSLIPIDYEARVDGARWRGLASLSLRALPDRSVRFNLFAIHGQGAARRYLAMAPVPGDKPDFHRLSYFAAWPWSR